MHGIPPAALLFVFAIMIVACGGGSDDDAKPTAPVATAEPTSGAPSDEIRSIDLEGTAAVQEFLGEIGGTYVQDNVLYADVTGDNVEDAVAPLASGGTLGDVAFIVVSPADGGVTEVLSVDAREFGISVGIEGGKLVTGEPVPGPDDPNCCPSQIRTTTYVGDGGTGLAEDSSTVGENPAGGAKTPSMEDD